MNSSVTTSAEVTPDSVSSELSHIRQLVKRDFEQVDALIERNLSSNVELASEISNYIVNAGGKRLRPMVALLTSRAMGYLGDNVVTLATLLEFLHTATLLHDDVVDNSSLRRGRKTANAIWGNAPSVIVGDFLYSRAFQLMVQLNRMDIMAKLSEATNLIAEGEVRQLANVGNPDLQESEYMEIIRCKSAVLFEAATETGALVANTREDTVEAARLFGLHFGLAYQLMDDLLDYAGDSSELGKNIGDDLAEGKTTLPLIFAMRNCSQEDREYLRKVIQNRFCDEPEKVISIIKSSGALGFVRTNALAQTNLSKNALYRIAPSRYRDGLESLSNLALRRLS